MWTSGRGSRVVTALPHRLGIAPQPTAHYPIPEPRGLSAIPLGRRNWCKVNLGVRRGQERRVQTPQLS